MTRAATLADRLDQKVFEAIYARALIYNSCWEDPAVDRRALGIGAADTVLVITSAGCNALDYALDGPARIHAVDANPRQTALLELKLAGIRRLDFDDFFAAFGAGAHREFEAIYRTALREELSPFARDYWDRHWRWFAPGRGGATFYGHGLSGCFARAFRGYLALRPRLHEGVEALLEARSLEEQREIYDREIAPRLWSGPLAWTLSRQITMSVLGVPRAQREEVERQHAGGLPVSCARRSSTSCVSCRSGRTTSGRSTCAGRHTLGCCPEYLKKPNFLALKAGLAGRISTHTCTVTDFLQRTEARVSRFVLLDHMDWMSACQPAALAEEWSAILARASASARVIFRSAHAQPTYLGRVTVGEGRARRPLAEVLEFHPALAARLQALDRVHTYAGFHIADVRA
ncbi:MAG: BtaA family protein [Burkholderiales bacterium]|nr:BtaA family protein [Burkholderiales bacterium]